MIEKLFDRTELPFPDNKIEIFTDGNGQLIKSERKEEWSIKEKRIIYGNPDPGDIETTDVENFNGILRERVGRLVRKKKCFSKRKRRLECSIELFQFYWNFINGFRRGTTPAMLEGLTDHPWNWHEFFYFRLDAID